MMDFIEAIQFICAVLYLALGWRGLFAMALVALGAGTLAFRIAYRLGQRSVAGISPKQYARLRDVARNVREEPATLASAIEREIVLAESRLRTRRGDDGQEAKL